MMRVIRRVWVWTLVVMMVVGATPAFGVSGMSGIGAEIPEVPQAGSVIPQSFGVAALMPTYSLKWGSQGVGNTQFMAPFFIDVDEDDYVYVADNGHNVVKKYTTAGNYVRTWGATGSANGQFLNPRAVHADGTGYVWVSDGGNSRVQKFSTTGVWYGAYTAAGMTGPIGICSDASYIYVAAETAGRVYKFTKSGSLVATIGAPGAGPGQLSNPVDVAIDSDGHLFVAEWNGNRISVFDAATGAFVRSFGSAGNAAGQLNGPAGLHIDGQDRVWVVEGRNERAQVFSKGGTFLTLFGVAGVGNGQFDYPLGVAANAQGVFVSELSNHRVQKFTFGEPKPTVRVGGADRYDTAVRIATSRYPGYAGVKHVIVTSGEDRAMADPLGAAQISGLYHAPILLTQSTTLNSRTKAALKAIRATNGPISIHVIGGTVAVPAAVFNQIKTLNPGGTTERLYGADRYATSVAMAKRAKTLLTARGQTTPGVMLFNAESSAAFYDALAASPMAAHSGLVMMGIKKGSVPTSVQGALGADFAGRPRYVVNSATYVSAANYSFLGGSGRMTSYSDRFNAARQISEWGTNRGFTSYRQASVANKLPDALTGGAFMGSVGGIMLYTDTATLHTVTSTNADTHDDEICKGWVLGGTASVSEAAKNTFNSRLQ